MCYFARSYAQQARYTNRSSFDTFATFDAITAAATITAAIITTFTTTFTTPFATTFTTTVNTTVNTTIKTTIIAATAGEKWITTVWMREGVSQDRPWFKSDPSGIPMMEE